MSPPDVDALDLRAQLATRGVRTTPLGMPVRRTGGAGPSDDGHVRLGGLATALPLVDDSPYALVEGRLTGPEGMLLDLELEPVVRPAFYDLAFADGTPYIAVARLHGTSVLASTVIQTCTRYTREDTRCRFCAIEQSLDGGRTPAVKTPEQLVEVARAAVALDGVEQVVLTTGTTPGSDRGAAHLVRVVRALTAALPGLPVQVQVEPPADLVWVRRLKEAGATAIGIHVESLDQAVRERWTPGKAEVPLRRYDEAWLEAVRQFGPNRVSTYVLLGLGEDADATVAACRRLVAMGVYPFVVPFRPMAGTLAADHPAPDAPYVADVTRRVARLLVDAGMRGADQGAGCAACGACGLLQAAGA
ncbi:MAG: Radical domain protein [Frankiales bacterium]|nr:Radical domain protein [Frankiales bacterium]